MPKQSTGAPRGGPPKSGAAASSKQPGRDSAKRRQQANEPPEAEIQEIESGGDAGEDDENEDPKQTIPPALLTRILHEFFEKKGTRLTKDANEAIAGYMDVFVREAIGRAAEERKSRFLEVCRRATHEERGTFANLLLGRGPGEDRAAALARFLRCLIIALLVR